MSLVALFDTHSVFFRAFHALPPMTTADGSPTSALYGFSVMLLKVLREYAPDEVAFALDLPLPTFRHEQFNAYKAHRERPPTPLLQQLAGLPAMLSVLGAPMWSAAGFEADDVLATLAARATSSGHEAIIVTGDRDLLQLAHESVRILFLGARGKPPALYDSYAVSERLGFPPANLPMLIALAGDKSDNIPGVAGVGDRTAKRLVRQFGTIANLLANLPIVRPNKLRDTLERSHEQMLLSENLAQLRADLELGEFPCTRAIAREGFARLRVLFEQLEFSSLLPRVDALVEARYGSR